MYFLIIHPWALTLDTTRLRRAQWVDSFHLPNLERKVKEPVRNDETQSASSPEKSRPSQNLLLAWAWYQKVLRAPKFSFWKILTFSTSTSSDSAYSDTF